MLGSWVGLVFLGRSDLTGSGQGCEAGVGAGHVFVVVVMVVVVEVVEEDSSRGGGVSR